MVAQARNAAGIEFVAGAWGCPSPFSSISEAKGMLLNGGIKMYNAAQQCIDEAFEKIEPVMQPE